MITRIHVRFDEISRRWETRVTFHPQEGFELGWPYWRARSRFRKRAIIRTVRAVLNDPSHRGDPIEIVNA